jgi:hypothetical protein
MSRKRTWKNKDGKTVRRKTLADHFVSRPVELLQSPALRVLSRAAHLALLRIELELRQHGGFNNGKLIVTTQQFIDYGIPRLMVASALRELVALGLIRITERGRGGNADYRRAHRFRLNFLCGEQEAQEAPPDHLWKHFVTLREAAAVAHWARRAKDRHQVADGRRKFQKTFPSPEKRAGPALERGPKRDVFSPQNRAESSVIPSPQNRATLETLPGVGGRDTAAEPVSLPPDAPGVPSAATPPDVSQGSTRDVSGKAQMPVSERAPIARQSERTGHDLTNASPDDITTLDQLYRREPPRRLNGAHR